MLVLVGQNQIRAKLDVINAQANIRTNCLFLFAVLIASISYSADQGYASVERNAVQISVINCNIENSVVLVGSSQSHCQDCCNHLQAELVVSRSSRTKFSVFAVPKYITLNQVFQSNQSNETAYKAWLESPPFMVMGRFRSALARTSRQLN